MKDFIEEFVNGHPFFVFIGSDSDVKDGTVVYATAIVVYRLGNGATYFYTVRKDGKKGDMYTRLFKEVEMSLEVAQFVEEKLKLGKPVIHLDIGYDGLSRDLVSTIVGYVRGMGYRYQIKPFSFAASKIAHKHTK